MQEFYINKDSVLPELRMDLILDGRYQYRKFYDAIQNADITFSMINNDTNIYKVCNSSCFIKLKDDSSCEDEYVICYSWNKHDTNERGSFKGIFNINFKNDLIDENGTYYPSGILKMPIREELLINII